MVNSTRMLKTALLAGAAVSGFLALAPAASAQENPYTRNRFTAVTDRYQPAFDPEPRRIGGLVLTGDLGLGLRRDSNIYATNLNPIEDTIYFVAPNFNLSTDWSNHQVVASVSAEHRQYQDNDKESATDVQALLGGRLDVTRDFHLRGQVGLQNGVEPRYSPSNIGAYAEQPEYNRTNAEVVAELDRDRLRVEAGVGTNTEDLGVIPLIGGGSVDLNFRDYTSTYFRGRVSYATSPNLAFFVQGRTENLDYDQGTANTILDRDLDRTTVLVGVNFELAAPFRGEVGVGYVQEDKFGSTADFDGFSANAKVNWFITELTTLTFAAYRDTYDPGIPISRTLVSTRYQFRADHELQRNILAFIDLETDKRDFQDVTRTDDFFSGTLGLAYKMNKRARIEASYTRRNLETNSDPAFAQDFEGDVFSIGLKLYP